MRNEFLRLVRPALSLGRTIGLFGLDLRAQDASPFSLFIGSMEMHTDADAFAWYIYLTEPIHYASK